MSGYVLLFVGKNYQKKKKNPECTEITVLSKLIKHMYIYLYMCSFTRTCVHTLYRYW